MKYEVEIAGRSYGIDLKREHREWRCRVDGESVSIDTVFSAHDILSLLAGGKSYEIKLERNGRELTIVLSGRRYTAEVLDPRSLRSRKRAALSEDGPLSVIAPMPGKVVRVLAPGLQLEPCQIVGPRLARMIGRTGGGAVHHGDMTLL